jgi:hypothetical protein
MDIIVDKPKLVKVVKLYLTKFFGDLTPKTNSNYPGSVFYVDSENHILMESSEESDSVYISYSEIWYKLETYFKLNFRDVRLIIKDWLKESPYNLEDVIPRASEALPQDFSELI